MYGNVAKLSEDFQDLKEDHKNFRQEFHTFRTEMKEDTHIFKKRHQRIHLQFQKRN